MGFFSLLERSADAEVTFVLALCDIFIPGRDLPVAGLREGLALEYSFDAPFVQRIFFRSGHRLVNGNPGKLC